MCSLSGGPAWGSINNEKELLCTRSYKAEAHWNPDLQAAASIEPLHFLYFLCTSFHRLGALLGLWGWVRRREWWVKVNWRNSSAPLGSDHLRREPGNWRFTVHCCWDCSSFGRTEVCQRVCSHLPVPAHGYRHQAASDMPGSGKWYQLNFSLWWNSIRHASLDLGLRLLLHLFIMQVTWGAGASVNVNNLLMYMN